MEEEGNVMDVMEEIDKRTQKILRNWILIGASATILLVITSLNIYYGIGTSIINLILLTIQFIILIISIKNIYTRQQGRMHNVFRTKDNISKRLKGR